MDIMDISRTIHTHPCTLVRSFVLLRIVHIIDVCMIYPYVQVTMYCPYDELSGCWRG